MAESEFGDFDSLFLDFFSFGRIFSFQPFSFAFGEKDFCGSEGV
jgi:hypothetical protein